MRIYEKADYDMISKWCIARDMKIPPAWSFPETGLIVDDVACGFLVISNNHCGWLDFYMSNPRSSKEIRNHSLDKITSNLIDLAKGMAIKMIFCNTQNPSIIDRALKHGFKSQGKFDCFERGL